MKILWFTNTMLPRVAKHLSYETFPNEGWLAGLSEVLLGCPDVELTVAFPMRNAQSVISGSAGSLAYCCYPLKVSKPTKYDKQVETHADCIISKASPDVVHIFGTEFPHTLAVINVCERLGMADKVLVHIQGLVSSYYYYYADLPWWVVNGWTIRDILRFDNIRMGRKYFKKRSKYEVGAIKKAHHVSGRTDWDKACTSQINPEAQYHFCNETLRSEFYNHSWDIGKCEKLSIFMSQAGYPLKGLHFMLEAMPEIVGRFSDAHLYIAGNDVTRGGSSLSNKLKITYYGKYIKSLIKKHQLGNHVTFTGPLDEKAMCERFLKSHVFVSASSIENSPNSLGEAMLLGVPAVSSNVGGVSNLIRHNEEGYLYQYNAPYMLAYYVCELFGDDELAVKFSQNAKRHAKETHDREKNAQRMVEIYKELGR